MTHEVFRLKRSYTEQYPDSGLTEGQLVTVYKGYDYGIADMDAMQLGRACISITRDLEYATEPFFVVVQSDLEAAL